MGLFLGDRFTRPTEQGGAWMGSLVHQNRLSGQRPVVVNNANFTRPPAGRPELLTLDEVVTVFHEFGHALHGLLPDVHLPSFSGTRVPRDFTEYPSRVLSRGNETAPMEAVEALLGRRPRLDALLEQRGLRPREEFVHRRRGAPAPDVRG